MLSVLIIYDLIESYFSEPAKGFSQSRIYADPVRYNVIRNQVISSLKLKSLTLTKDLHKESFMNSRLIL